MAVLSTTALTLVDWAKRLDPDGTVPVVAELLSQTNAILTDAMFVEGNLPTGHRVTVRTGLPTAYWRALNAGVPTSKSTTATIDEACGMLEARSDIDKDLAMLNGNTAAFRMSEDSAFIEAMNIAQANTMFYGNVQTDPKAFVGLATRYGTISGAGNAANILDAGGAAAGDNNSVYLVVWGDNTVYCTFPKGSQAGLIHQDLGEIDAFDPSNNKFRALSTRYQWKNGLVVKDWRYVVRICNIKTSDLIAGTGTQATTATTELVKLLHRALYRVPNISNGRAAIYMNRTVHSALSVAGLGRSNAVFGIQQAMTQYGTPSVWTTFQGVPIRVCDALLSTENRVV